MTRKLASQWMQPGCRNEPDPACNPPDDRFRCAVFTTLHRLLLALPVLFKSPWFKGFIGEVMVNLSARLFLIKNVTIQTGDSSACQKRECPLAETGSISMIFNA